MMEFIGNGIFAVSTYITTSIRKFSSINTKYHIDDKCRIKFKNRDNCYIVHIYVNIYIYI